MSPFQSGNQLWKLRRLKRGAIHRDRKGHILVYMPEHRLAHSNGCVFLHRLIYELYNRCCLLYWSDVHHINGIPDDNRFENLQGMIHGNHSSSHHPNRIRRGGLIIPSNRYCSICGSQNTYVDRYGKSPKWSRDGKGGFICGLCYGRSYRINTRH